MTGDVLPPRKLSVVSLSAKGDERLQSMMYCTV